MQSKHKQTYFLQKIKIKNIKNIKVPAFHRGMHIGQVRLNLMRNDGVKTVLKKFMCDLLLYCEILCEVIVLRVYIEDDTQLLPPQIVVIEFDEFSLLW